MKDLFNTKFIENAITRWIYIISLTVTLGFLFILAIRLPIADYIPYWFWKVTTIPRTAWWLFFPLLALSIGVILLSRKTTRHFTVLCLIILICIINQHVFGMMEGRGIDGIRDRAVKTGHANFVFEALTQPSFFVIASFYQILIEGTFPIYPYATKPPGHLLFYMLSERISHFLPGDWGSPTEKLATFMALTWPVLASLPVIFIDSLAADIYSEPRPYIIASLLYVFIPAVMLIPLHLDQCLYPLLFISLLTIFSHGIKKKSHFLLFITGTITGAIIFMSFSLTVAPIFILLILTIKTMADIFLSSRENMFQVLITGIKAGAAYGLGFLFMEAVLFFSFGYNIVENYSFAMLNHFNSRIQVWTPQLTLQLGGMNTLEYALWTGLPLFVLAMIQGVRSLGRIISGNSDIVLIMGAAFPILFFALTFQGRNVGETARLWIFLSPLVAIFAGKEIVDTFRQRAWHATTFLIMLQMLTAFALKMWQDFY